MILSKKDEVFSEWKKVGNTRRSLITYRYVYRIRTCVRVCLSLRLVEVATFRW